MALVLPLLLLALAGDALAWDSTDTACELAYATAHVMDWRQTLDIKRHPGMYETNPILGRHPHDDKINAYFAGTLLAHAVVSYLLPGKYRHIWQGLSIGAEGYQVYANYQLGLRF